MRTDKSNSAVLDETAKAAPAKPKTAPVSRPKRQPPYGVVIENDELHTFAYVVEALCRTFGYSSARSYRYAWEAHLRGRAVVWTGSMEVAEFKRDRLRSFGPDIYASRQVDFPLGCSIEPMPD